MIFQRTLLTLLLTTLVACGGGSDSSRNEVTTPPSPPQDGISGTVAARVNGGQISVHDATGAEIVIASGRTTGPNGHYSLVFSEFDINAGIIAPLLVTLDGTGATAVCDYDQAGNNDCLAKDGSFVSFGETYPLPDGFTLQAIAESFPQGTGAGDRVITVNLSVASHLAAHYAVQASGGNQIRPADVRLANQQALGVVEFVTGLSTGGNMLNDINIADPTTGNINSTDSLALALFGAGLQGLVDPETPNSRNYPRVLQKLIANVKADTSNATDHLRASGAYLAEAMTGYLTAANSFQAALSVPSPILQGSIASRTTSIPLLQQIAGNPVSIALPPDPGLDDPLDRAKTLTTRLSDAMGATLLISGTTGFGGTTDGAALVFDEQLALIRTLVSVELRRTLLQLDRAITTAFTNNQTELTGTNVSGVLAFEGDLVSMTTATSTTSNIQSGISVNVTIPAGTRKNPGGSGTFDASEITISVSQTQNDLTTQQLFEGALVLDMQSANGGVDVGSLGYSGDLRTTSGLPFTGDIAINGLSTVSETSLRGQYDTAFTFADGSRLKMNGLLQSRINIYNINVLNHTIVTDLQTNVITDMNAELNLVLDAGGSVMGGTITANGTEAATMDANGIVSFSDGTAISLPTPVL